MFWVGSEAHGQGHDRQVFHPHISCSALALPSAIFSVSSLWWEKKEYFLFLASAPLLQSPLSTSQHTHTHTHTDKEHFLSGQSFLRRGRGPQLSPVWLGVHFWWWPFYPDAWGLWDVHACGLVRRFSVWFEVSQEVFLRLGIRGLKKMRFKTLNSFLINTWSSLHSGSYFLVECSSLIFCSLNPI